MTMNVRFALVIAIFGGFAGAAFAGEYNQVLSIGDKAPDWKDLPAADGGKYSLNDFRLKDVLVLTFTCVSCPAATDYEPRLNALAKKYSGPMSQVGVIAVCVNDVKQDRLDRLVERTKLKGLVFPYLYDGSQKIARDHGAIFTPEFYVFNKERKLIYMGAMDDATDPAKVTIDYVQTAIDAALENKLPKVQETVARGCRVRYRRERE